VGDPPLFLEVNLRGTTVLLATTTAHMIHRVGRRVLTLDAGRLINDQEIPGSDPPRLEVRRPPPRQPPSPPTRRRRERCQSAALLPPRGSGQPWPWLEGQPPRHLTITVSLLVGGAFLL